MDKILAVANRQFLSQVEEELHPLDISVHSAHIVRSNYHINCSYMGSSITGNGNTATDAICKIKKLIN